MELITHLYACWGAALHQNCADADAEADADPDAVVGADAKAFPDWLSGFDGQRGRSPQELAPRAKQRHPSKVSAAAGSLGRFATTLLQQIPVEYDFRNTQR